MPSEKRFKIKYILFLLITLAVLTVFIYAIDYFFIKKHVVIKPSPGSTISLIKENKTIINTSKERSVQVRSGVYTVKYSAGSDYEVKTDKIDIKSKTVLSTPKLNYSQEKLGLELDKYKEVVKQAINQDPKLKDYNIEKEALLIRGDWYGAMLVPKSWYDPTVPADYIPRPVNEQNTLDIQKIVMKKSGDSWVVAIKPTVVLNIKDGSGIPEEVIREVNRWGHL